MEEDNPGPPTARRPGPDPVTDRRTRSGNGTAAAKRPGEGAPGWIIETVVSPFHCLYQDALHFHTQSQLWLVRSEAEASRLARAALLLYLSSAEALVHQAALELGRPELTPLLADPNRPLPLADTWRLLPAIVAGGPGPAGPFDPELPPWPQFAELLGLADDLGLPGSSGGPSRLLPRPAPRRRLRADGATPGPARPGPGCPRRSTSPAPDCRAIPMPCGPATSTPPAASSTPPSPPSTAASTAPSPRTSATAASRSARWQSGVNARRSAKAHAIALAFLRSSSPTAPCNGGADAGPFALAKRF